MFTDPLLCMERESLFERRLRERVRRLEQERANALFSAGRIGRVTHKQPQVEVSIANRRVNFKWQRGIKIGLFFSRTRNQKVVCISSCMYTHLIVLIL